MLIFRILFIELVGSLITFLLFFIFDQKGKYKDKYEFESDIVGSLFWPFFIILYIIGFFKNIVFKKYYWKKL